MRKQKIDIYFICAIRREVADQILGEDIGKIIRDLGQEVSWSRGTWTRSDENFIHPLFEIVLRRIILSNNPERIHISESEIVTTYKEFFPFNLNGNTQREILDLTTYRPRDLVVLFEAAKSVDKHQDRFRANTFKTDCRKNYREQLWGDFADALRMKYAQNRIDLFRKIFFQLPHEFYYQDFVNKLDDFSDDPVVCEIIDNSDKGEWANILKDIYEIGAVGNFYLNTDGNGRYRFHSRADTDGLYIAKGYKIIKCRGLH